MIFATFAEVLLPVLVVVFCGFALRHAFPLDMRSLSRVSLYILSPVLIFTTLAQINVAGGAALRLTIFSVGFSLVIGLMTWIIAIVLKLDRSSVAALLLCTMFMNAGNFGLPTSQFAFGDDGFQRALLFFIPQAIVSQLLAVPIARSGQGDGYKVIFQIFRMPHIYAAVIGLGARLSGLELAVRTDILGQLFDGMELLSGATLPFLLLVLGANLASGVVIEDRKLMVVATVLRLIVSPPLAYGLTFIVGLDDLSARVAVLQASMPTAVNMVLFSTEFGARPRLVAGVVVVTTLVSLITLTMLLSVLR
ncbi:MAG: transporter [Chloroflexi bacterium AL-W]|nr:transporter [Chloroflexi bacterium AL-N1]NOK70613.1 transporter [Chloroflexi bacterium AL-N10]NOK77605.1 transporter [Chloroflexi bacterium AL-N5]NOK84456.1 transporter [Chloroflexi bacterium AL-W]NOK92345.1 transporter [Chloroflexi bacterium AL-N15]